MADDRTGPSARRQTMAGRCPICGEPRQPAYRPFCSKRCRNVDLGRWFNEVYAVPAVDPAEDEDDEDAGEGDR